MEGSSASITKRSTPAAMRVRVLGARGRFAPAALASSGYMKMGLHWMLKSMKSAIGLYGRSLPARTSGDFRGPYCGLRSEEHTSELQSLMRNSYAVFCLKKKQNKIPNHHNNN